MLKGIVAVFTLIFLLVFLSVGGLGVLIALVSGLFGLVIGVVAAIGGVLLGVIGAILGAAVGLLLPVAVVVLIVAGLVSLLT